MERIGYIYSDDSDSLKTTAGGTFLTGRGQFTVTEGHVTVTVVTVTVQRRLLEGPGGHGKDGIQ